MSIIQTDQRTRTSGSAKVVDSLDFMVLIGRSLFKMNKMYFLCLLGFPAFASAQAQAWTLQQCIDTAVQNNLTILSSELAVRSSEIDLNQRKWDRFPTLNGNVGQSIYFGRSVDQTTYQINNQTTASNSFSLSSGVVLYNGGQLRNAVLQSQLDLNASGFDVQKVKDDISLAVVNAFVQVLYAREAQQNSRLQLEATQAQIDALQIFVTAGKRTESDLYQLKAQLATDKYDISVADGQRRNARLSLLQLMEIPYNEQFDVQAPILPDPIIIETPDVNALFEAALETQPVIKRNALSIKSAEAGRRIALGALQPRVSLNAGLGSNYSSNRKSTSVFQQDVLQTIGYLKSNPDETVLGYVSRDVASSKSYPFFSQLNDNFNQSISLNVAIPIFNNLQARNNILKQDIAISAAHLDDGLARNQLRKSVEAAYVDLINAQSKYNAARETLAAEQIAFQNLKILFEADKSTATDLLIEQNRYFQIQSQLLQARYDLVWKLKVLDFYQGKTLNF